MSVRTDVINLNVTVNGDNARNQLNELRKKAADVKTEMANLKKGTAEYIAKKQELAGLTQEMSNLKKQIGLTSLTQKELAQEIKNLTALRNSVTPFTAEWKKYDDQLKKVQARHYEVKNGVEGVSVILHKMSDEVKQLGILAAGYLGFEFLATQVTGILRGAGRLSDQLADVRRVAGLTALEAQNLNSQLSKLDTRTSTSGLREIAIIAGKLGVAKEDILGFVQATDKLVVAMGDELGNADQITTELGKILNVFDGTITGDNITKLGNAIVDLANKGVATGGFIVDFTQRLAGLAKTANVTLDASIGLAAGLEESGQRSESSSTAIIKVLSAIGKDVEKFAKAAGKPVDEFSKTLRDKPIEALIQLSEGLVKNKKGFDEISQSFNAVGEDGARIVTTLGVIGGKADFFRGKIKDAGEALKSTGEIDEAFTLKNETLGATLDKLGKEFNKMATSNAVTGFLKSAAEGALNFFRWIKNLPEFISENRTAITFLTGVVLTYLAAKTKATQSIILNRLATLLEIAADKIEAAQKAVNIALTQAYAYVKGVLTGQIKLATVAQQAWNLALKLNPIGLVIAAVTVLATGIAYLSNKTKELTAAQRVQNDLHKKIIEYTADEESRAQSLFKTLQQGNLTYDAKKDLLNKLIALNPQYLGGLNAENVTTKEGAKIMENYVTQLRKANEEKARAALIDEKQKQLQQAKLDMANTQIDVSDNTMLGNVKDLASMVGIGKGTGIKQLRDKAAEVAGLEKELDALYAGTAAAANKAVAEAGAQGADVANKTAAKTIAMLKKQIEDLDKAFENLDITDSAGIKKNRDERKKLQQQLEALEGKEKSAGSDKYKELLKQAEAFHKKIVELQFQAQNANKSKDEAEIEAVRHKYDELLKEYDAFAAKLRGKDKSKLGSRSTITNAFEEEMKKTLLKQFSDNAAEEYKKSQADSALYFENLKQQQSEYFIAGKINKKSYENALKEIEREAAIQQAQIAVDYSAVVKQAADDVTKFKKQQLDKQVQDAIAAYEQQKANDELIKKIKQQTNEQSDKTKIATGNPNTKVGRKQRTDAELDLLKLETQKRRDELNKQRDDVLQNTSLTEEEKAAMLANIEQQITDFEAEQAQKRKDIIRQAAMDEIQISLDKAQRVMQVVATTNQIIDNLQNASFQREQRRNELAKQNLQKALNAKLISQNQFNVTVEKMDAEMDKKKREMERQQAIRKKSLNAFGIVIDTAAAIAKASPNIFQMALAAAVGAAQLGVVLSEPLPQLGTGGWIKEGKKHSEGGINANIERDEAVISANAMTDGNTYTVTGTPAQITSALNANAGGVSWAAGATLQPAWRTAKPVQINPAMPRIMAMGGFNAATQQAAGNTDATAVLLQTLIAKHDAFAAEIAAWQGRIHTVYTASDVKNRRIIDNYYDAAKNASKLNQ